MSVERRLFFFLLPAICFFMFSRVSSFFVAIHLFRFLSVSSLLLRYCPVFLRSSASNPICWLLLLIVLYSMSTFGSHHLLSSDKILTLSRLNHLFVFLALHLSPLLHSVLESFDSLLQFQLFSLCSCLSENPPLTKPPCLLTLLLPFPSSTSRQLYLLPKIV